MLKKITTSLFLVCCFLLSLSVNANPYYEAIHCFDERLDEPQEGDIARCLLGDNNEYMCPINSAACTVESDFESVEPTCSSGLAPVNGVCKEVKPACYFDSHAYFDNRVIVDFTNGTNSRKDQGHFVELNGSCIMSKPILMNGIHIGCEPIPVSAKAWKGNLRVSYHEKGGSSSNCGATLNYKTFSGSSGVISRTGTMPSWFTNGAHHSWCLIPNGMVYKYEFCTNIESVEYPTSCPDGFDYNAENKKCERGTTTNVCPLGDQYQCVTSGNASYCSPNTCFNPDEDKEEIDDQIDGGMLENNGATDDEGMCLDQIYIFSGRAQKCRKQGVQTAFQDCCKPEDKVLQDGSGSFASSGMTHGMNAIKGIYDAAKVAHTTYSAQVAAGVTEAFASELAASAFQQQIMVGFDPTSIAISIAISLVMDYLMKSCDQMEVETAIANSSKMCVYVGEYCKEKWLGKCVQKAKSYCCFNSQLAKIINEQGRLQLKSFQNIPNRGFGETKNPECRGFTPEEFQALDFSNIDMTEYYDELIHKSQAEIEKTMEQMTSEHFNNVN